MSFSGCISKWACWIFRHRREWGSQVCTGRCQQLWPCHSIPNSPCCSRGRAWLLASSAGLRMARFSGLLIRWVKGHLAIVLISVFLLTVGCLPCSSLAALFLCSTYLWIHFGGEDCGFCFVLFSYSWSLSIMGAYKKCLPPSCVLLLNAIFDFQHLLPCKEIWSQLCHFCFMVYIFM